MGTGVLAAEPLGRQSWKAWASEGDRAGFEPTGLLGLLLSLCEPPAECGYPEFARPWWGEAAEGG